MRPPVRGTMVADKYELIEEIGRGGMGVVWRAYASSLGLHCALKMVLSSSEADRDRKRLLREARVAAKLRSPYIVTIYDVGEWNGCGFIAMELLEGQSLGQWLASVGRLSREQTLELVRQVALGLEKAHAAGLVHRDLKPDNIFVVERDPLLVKLLDFGIAKQLQRDPGDPSLAPSITGALVGTPRYMSPEQANGAGDLDYRSDLWSLAVIAFECLTGQPPFDGDTWPHLLVNIYYGPIPVPSQVQPDVPAGFDDFWKAAAVREREARPASARALAELLRAQLDKPVRNVEEVLPPSAATAPRRRALLVGSAALALACAAAWHFMQSRRQHPALVAPARAAQPIAQLQEPPRELRPQASVIVPAQPASAPAGGAVSLPGAAPQLRAPARARSARRVSGPPIPVEASERVDAELGF